MKNCNVIHLKIIKLLEKKLNIILSLDDNNILNEAMKYSAIHPGKCARPMLMFAVAKVLDGSIAKILDSAAAIEIIHTYSLIHDDLPAMDNDDYRRGKLSCHKKYSEAIAILAGDSLLTFAFEILATINAPSNIKCIIIKNVAEMIGVKGMAGGQMLDISFENKDANEKEIFDIMTKKTGCLFAVAAETSALLSGSNYESAKLFKKFGLNLGILFQMRDDILDEVGTLEELGKNTQKDKQAGKATLVSLFGIKKAQEKYLEHLKYTKNLVIDLPRKDYLLKLLDYLLLY